MQINKNFSFKAEQLILLARSSAQQHLLSSFKEIALALILFKAEDLIQHLTWKDFKALSLVDSTHLDTFRLKMLSSSEFMMNDPFKDNIEKNLQEELIFTPCEIRQNHTIIKALSDLSCKLSSVGKDWLRENLDIVYSKPKSKKRTLKRNNHTPLLTADPSEDEGFKEPQAKQKRILKRNNGTTLFSNDSDSDIEVKTEALSALIASDSESHEKAEKNLVKNSLFNQQINDDKELPIKQRLKMQFQRS